jgi:predicted CoA-binding protein
MSIPNPNTTELSLILRETRTVAVVGASDDPARPSNDVFGYLARSSHFELYPVNPNVTEVGGVTAYPRLADVPVAVDMVDVFRRYDDLPGVLRETLELTPRPKYLWLQQGLWHDEVGEAACAAGMTVIMDRCLKVDYALLVTGS